MIYFKYDSTVRKIEWDGMACKKMTNLKTLIIEHGKFSGGPGYLPSSLRYWEWIYCPLESLSCISSKASEISFIFQLCILIIHY